MTTPAHPIPRVLSRVFELVAAEVAARKAASPANPDLDIRVDLGDPGRFEEYHAIGIGLAAIQSPVEDRPIMRGIGNDNHDFEILCIAMSWSGDQDRITWMALAYGLVDIVRDVLEENRNLGLAGVVDTAWVDRTTFGWQVEGLMARKAIVEFTIRVRAYRSRRR